MKSPLRPSGPAALALLGAALFGMLPAAAQGGGEAAAKEALAPIAAREGQSGPARLTLAITERRGKFVEGEKLPDLRARLLKDERALSASGKLLFSRDGWLKEVAVSTLVGGEPAQRTRTAEVGGLRRMLVESRERDGDRRNGLVTRATSTAPGDAILTRRVAQAAEGIRWTSSRKEGDRLMLEGQRGDERHTLSVRTAPPVRVEAWALKRTLRGPAGTVEQTYHCEVSYGEGPDAIRSVDEWVINPPPYANVAFRSSEVKEVEPIPTASFNPQSLSIRFPKDTLVQDHRGEVPVEYEQTEEGIDEEEIAAFAREEAANRAKPGQPAPAFELKEVGGKNAKLADYRGKPLLLFWFATWSEASEEAAKVLAKLSESYKRRVQIVAISTAEEERPGEKVQAFKKQYGWSFPVLLDLSGDSQRRYGSEPAVPKVAIVDEAGKLVYVRPGMDEKAVSATLDRLLGGAESPARGGKGKKK